MIYKNLTKLHKKDFQQAISSLRKGEWAIYYEGEHMALALDLVSLNPVVSGRAGWVNKLLSVLREEELIGLYQKKIKCLDAYGVPFVKFIYLLNKIK